MGSRILLADDSITIQKVVNLTFQDEGIEVVSVSNGDMAERRLKEVHPDLVLADIFMPGKNGYELCETIKQDPELNSVPVVLLVGAFEPFNEAEARRVHADAHLTKPFESRVLVETVKSLIDKHPKAASSVNHTQPVTPQASPYQTKPEMNAFPPQPSIPVPPFNLDTALMGDPFPPALTHQEVPPLAPQPLPQEATFTPTAVTNFTEAAPLTEAFPPVFVNEPMQEQPEFSLTAPSQPAQWETTNQAETTFQIDEPINLDPMLSTFAEQQNSVDSTLVLGSYMPETANINPDTNPLDDRSADFEPVEAPQPSAANGGFDFEVEYPQPSTSIADTFVTEPLNQPVAVAESKFTTNELEPTPVESDGLHHQAATLPEPTFTTENDLSAVAANSELLATDEPLGDILDNPLPVDATLSASSPLELEDAYVETASAQMDATPEPQTVPAPVTEIELGNTQATPIEMTVDADSVQPSVEPTTKTMPAFNEFNFTTQEPETFESAPAAGEPIATADALQDSPVTTAYEIVQPADAPVAELPPQVFQSATEAAVAENHLTETPSSFNGLDQAVTEPVAMMTDFTPVNLETAAPLQPVVEAVAPVAAPKETHVVNQDAPQALAIQQDSVQELPSSTSPKEVTHQGGAMSQELIDEIVRRVVAQLSDRVVREIAWEVVPDCVERVVSNLTKEGLTSKLAN
ncbi:MAG: response regulator [Acidobacteriota bacterium]